jgi:hypothetical protein
MTTEVRDINFISDETMSKTYKELRYFGIFELESKKI